MAADINHAGCHVGSGIDVQAVDVAGDLQNVVTLFEVHHDILAAAAGEHESVMARAAKQRVVAGSAVDDVVARTAEYQAAAGVAFQHIVSGIALNDIVAVTAEEDIVTGATADGVVA